MNELLRVNNLTKSFGAKAVLKNLSFSIGAGERVTFFAPSGSGKSTLIHILSRLDADFDGTFTCDTPRSATIFQEPRLFPYMTIEENIFFPFTVQRLEITRRISEQYAAWLNVCDLSDDINHYPYQLSGGMKQKVSLIRSFLTNPDFLMMDEPFKSIDIASKNAMIRHIVAQYPALTILLVTHNLDEIPLLTQSLFVFTASPLSVFTTYSNLSALGMPALFSCLEKEFGGF